MSKKSKKKWGIFELENATGKNSQRAKIQLVKVLDKNEFLVFAKLAFSRLLQVWKT